MKKYAVAWTSLFDNISKITIVEAESEVDAVIAGMQELGPTTCDDWLDSLRGMPLEQVEEDFFNCDQLVAVLQLD